MMRCGFSDPCSAASAEPQIRKRIWSGVSQHHKRNRTKQKTDPKVGFLFGGGWWIRTTEVSDNRFTVCPLWPLGNAPMS